LSWAKEAEPALRVYIAGLLLILLCLLWLV
jgi:hypothetical protein